jgi:hypothetical protein
MHLVNKFPVDLFTKQQGTVETAAHGSEFVAAHIPAMEQVMALWTVL